MNAFDTHQRLDLLKRFLEHLLPGGAEGAAQEIRKEPSVLDIGGYPALMARQLEERLRVITVDCKEGDLKDYILASGCHLPFGDETFGASVASDVLEHIPGELRESFLSEMTRVSGGWVFVGGPFRSKEVAQAEASINDLNRSVHGHSNPWLDEHDQCGLPDLTMTRGALEGLGLVTLVVPNGSLFTWFLLKSMELLLHALPNAFQHFESLNDLYIRHWSETDHQRPTYRHLLIAHRDEKAIEKLIESPPPHCCLQFFAPGCAPPPCEEEATRIRAAAQQFDKILSSLAQNAAPADGAPQSIDAEYLARLEAIIETQEAQRQSQDEEIKALRAEIERRPQGLKEKWTRHFRKK